MLQVNWLNYVLLIKRLLFILLLFQLSRFVFGLVNPATYHGELLPVFKAGLRYDITAICILNCLIILLHLYQGKHFFGDRYQLIISILSLIINSFALLFNTIDTGWFSYIQKRSTADVFGFLLAGKDVSNNLPQYLTDYWYLLLFWILMISALVLFERNLRRSVKRYPAEKMVFARIPFRILTAVLFLGVSILGFRGGIQLKPLSVQTAAKLVPSSSIPLVLNTPYTIIKSWNDQLLDEPEYMSLSEAEKILPIHSMSQPDSAFHPYNVVCIIMESFSFEHISYYNKGETTTPFFDSLLRSTQSWPNTFANAKRSIEGIPAVLTSLPALMDQPFINSAYNVNAVNSLASLLHPFGYHSGFFHGGNNGTMGFDNFTRLAGYDNYFGKNEYDGNAADFDGHWGIYDHSFFSFMIRKLNTWKEPFHAAFFSISSHHPYKVPDAYKHLIHPNDPPIQSGMRYADAALASFFNDAKKQAWYPNTIFIITSDHSGPAGTPYSSNRLGAYHIPLLIIAPGDSGAKIHPEIAQQCDILPTILHLLNYHGKYSSFGRNLLSSSKGWSVNYSTNSWELITDNYILLFDGEESTHLYSREDLLLKRNIIFTHKDVAKDLEVQLKAILQQYRHALIHNQLVKQ